MNDLQPIKLVETYTQRTRNKLIQTLIATGRWIDSHGTLCLIILLAVYFLADLGYSLSLPLWHDELFTFYISQAKNLGELFFQTRTIDLNPPLSYLLTRATYHLLGVGTLQTRLPEIIGFSLALTGIYLFVRRRSGSAYGLLAASLLFASKAGDVSIQARPYGLMLGFATLSLFAWQTSSEALTKRRAYTSDALLLLALSLMLLSHLFGLMVWFAIVLGECVQILQRRQAQVSRCTALLLPLASCYFYLPLLRNHGQSAYPVAFQPSGDDIFAFYIGHIDRELISIWLAALVLITIAGRSWLRGSKCFSLTTPEWSVIICFLLAPLVLIAHLMLRQGAFFERYGVIACVGVAVLFTVFFAWWTDSRSSAAIIAAIIALTITSRLVIAIDVVFRQRAFQSLEPVVQQSHLDTLTDPTLPLVDGSGLTFIEMQRRESSALLNRTYYLTGGPVAIQYAHATIFEGMGWEVDNFHLQGHVDNYAHFCRQHPHFYVFGTYEYPEDWLLRKLQADGANIRRIGTVHSSYMQDELYEITTK